MTEWTLTAAYVAFVLFAIFFPQIRDFLERRIGGSEPGPAPRIDRQYLSILHRDGERTVRLEFEFPDAYEAAIYFEEIIESVRAGETTIRLTGKVVSEYNAVKVPDWRSKQ